MVVPNLKIRQPTAHDGAVTTPTPYAQLKHKTLQLKVRQQGPQQHLKRKIPEVLNYLLNQTCTALMT
jgi:hypothetical protein